MHDVLLISTSAKDIKEMLKDMVMEASRHGLELHPDKTKMLSNTMCKSIEVLKFEGNTTYLGWKLASGETSEVEISNRISMAWRKFSSLKQELTNKAHSITYRMQLFHGAITPTVL